MAEDQGGKKPDPVRFEEKVIRKLVKACVTSAKANLTILELERDFHVMVGRHIPYREFGYETLDAFVESMPAINVRRGPNGVTLLRPRKGTLDNDVDGWLSDTGSSQNSRELKKADPDLKCRQSSDAFSAIRRPLNFPAYNPPEAATEGHQPVNTNPNYLGKHFIPGYKPWLPKYRGGPRFQSPEREASWEVDDEKLVPQVPLPERHNSKQMTEKVSEVTLDCVSPELEPFGPRMFIAKGLAKMKEKERAESKRIFEVEQVNLVDKLTTVAEYATIKDFLTLQNFLVEIGLPQALFQVEKSPEKKCVITVHLFTFAGIPKEGQTLISCFEETAIHSLQVLLEMKIAKEEDWMRPVDVVNRILALVYAQPAGIWRSYIPQAYATKFGEEPPESWAELFLAKTENVAVVRVSVEPNDITSEIWKPKLVSAAGMQPAPLSPSLATISQLPSCPLQRTRNLQGPRKFNPTTPITMKPAKTPHEPAIIEQVHMAPRNKYPVDVTVIMPDCSFWVRVATREHPDGYEKMMKDLSSFCATDKEQVLIPTVGACYAAFLRSAWHRVKLSNTLHGGMAIVWLIDVGEVEKIALQAIFHLPGQFTNLPGTAVRCIMDGFEVFDSREEYLTYLRETVASRRFVADVRSSDGELANVYLYGTGNSSDFVVNYHASGYMSRGISKYRDLCVDEVYRVRVSHVAETGSVYVTIHDIAQTFQKLMSKQMEHKLLHHAPKRVVEMKVGEEIYFARLLDTENSIYRVVALTAPESGRVFVSFIDSGDKGYVPLSCVYDLEGFFPQLYYLGPQALMVRLAMIPADFITKAMGQRLRELAPGDLSILMRVTVIGVVPKVELFKRLMPDNILVSVNNTLLLDPALQGQPAMVSPEAFSLAATTTERIATLSLAIEPFSPTTPYTTASELVTLPRALVPPVGAEFDIHVPMVANPKNFIVQPWNSFFALQTLMYELQAAYENSGPEDAPLPSDVVPGQGYAALHQDGRWYRVIASSQMINEDTVLGNFADYGDLQVLQLANLRRLAPRFCQLPCQAIRAYLYGVKPLHQDWCVQDCIAFQALVNEHQFVSIVMSKPSNNDDPQEASVGLKLIDTSGSKDVHIAQLLVSEGRAEFLVDGI